MPSDGSVSSNGSQIQQFGLYRTIDARTEEFLRSSRKRQIKQGCACAAISTAITVTVVVSVILVYEYSINSEANVTKKNSVKPHWIGLMNDSDITSISSKFNKKINFDRTTLKLLPILLKALNKNRYLEKILEEYSGSNTPILEIDTTETTFTRNIFADSKNWLKLPTTRHSTLDYKSSPLTYWKSPTKRLEYLSKIRKIRDYQRVLNYFDKMVNDKAGQKKEFDYTENPLTAVTAPMEKKEKVTKIQAFRNFVKAKKLETKENNVDVVGCSCPKNLGLLLSKLVASIQDSIPQIIKNNVDFNPCENKTKQFSAVQTDPLTKKRINHLTVSSKLAEVLSRKSVFKTDAESTTISPKNIIIMSQCCSKSISPGETKSTNTIISPPTSITKTTPTSTTKSTPTRTTKSTTTSTTTSTTETTPTSTTESTTTSTAKSTTTSIIKTTPTSTTKSTTTSTATSTIASIITRAAPSTEATTTTTTTSTTVTKQSRAHNAFKFRTIKDRFIKRLMKKQMKTHNDQTTVTTTMDYHLLLESPDLPYYQITEIPEIKPPTTERIESKKIDAESYPDELVKAYLAELPYSRLNIEEDYDDYINNKLGKTATKYENINVQNMASLKAKAKFSREDIAYNENILRDTSMNLKPMDSTQNDLDLTSMRKMADMIYVPREKTDNVWKYTVDTELPVPSETELPVPSDTELPAPSDTDLPVPSDRKYKNQKFHSKFFISNLENNNPEIINNPETNNNPIKIRNLKTSSDSIINDTLITTTILTTTPKTIVNIDSLTPELKTNHHEATFGSRLPTSDLQIDDNANEYEPQDEYALLAAELNLVPYKYEHATKKKDISNRQKPVSKQTQTPDSWEFLKNEEKILTSHKIYSMIPSMRPMYLEIQRNNDWKQDEHADYDIYNNFNNNIFDLPNI